MGAAAMISVRELNRAYLARQHLLARSTLSPLAMIRHLVAVQAQLPRPAFLALHTRLERFARDELIALVTSRQVVRATALRGTLHAMCAADYVQLRPALQGTLDAGMRAILGDRVAALDLAALAREAQAWLPATFEVLRPRLAAAFPGFDERALGYALRTQLPLVQVPVASERWGYPGTAAFTDAAGWLGCALGGDTGLALRVALVRRYLAAYGPASVADAQRWSAVPKLAPAFEALRASSDAADELVVFRDDRKRELFDLRAAPRPGADADAPVRLVGDFDNVVLGHDDRRRIVADDHRAALQTKNAQIKAVLLVDGFVAGSWTVAATKRKLTVAVTPFGTLGKPVRRDLEAEAVRLAPLFGDELAVELVVA